MRLQKFMALCGVASRRKCEELIQAGLVSVNGKPVTVLGTQVDERNDVVEYSGRILSLPEERRTILFYKPACCVCTVSDPEGRQTVMDYLKDVPERVYPVGRLDYMTEGLLLLTNDGDLARFLMHPSSECDKTYRADIRGQLTENEIETLRNGVLLSDGPTSPAGVETGPVVNGIQTVCLTIHEGRNRQIRRMLEAVGREVIYLCRIGYSGLSLEGLHPGQYRDLTQNEIDMLKTTGKSSK